MGRVFVHVLVDVHGVVLLPILSECQGGKHQGTEALVYWNRASETIAYFNRNLVILFVSISTV